MRNEEVSRPYNKQKRFNHSFGILLWMVDCHHKGKNKNDFLHELSCLLQETVHLQTRPNKKKSS